MWNLRGQDGASSNPKASIAAGKTRVYLTPEPCPAFGWVIALQTDQSNSQLTGTLKASYAGAGTEEDTIAGSFNVSPMDVFFIPYPSVQLELAAEGSASADAQVNFYPVNDAATALVYRSVLHYFDTNTIGAGSTETLDPPEGATGWWPAMDNADSLDIALQNPAGDDLFVYTLGGTNDVDFPTATGAQYFPLFDGAQLAITNGSGGDIDITIVWQYNFRRPGGV